MKVGYYVTEDAGEVIDRIVLADRLGLDSAWLGDHFAFWAVNRTFPETWSMLSVAASRTKKIMIGSGVTDPFRRNIALLAQSAATLDYLSQGRGILGIGGGEVMNIVPYGIEYRKPLSRLREAITLVRALWKSSVDNPVSHSSEFHQLSGAFIQVSPVKNKAMPVYVSGTSPLAKRIAGELGDGWYGHITSPRVFEEDLKDVRDAARGAQRDPEVVEPVAWTMCFLDKDRETALRRAFPYVASELVVNHHTMAKLGYDVEVPEDLSLKKLLVTRELVAKLQEQSKLVPVRAVEETTAFGTPDDCISLFERFAKAGARHVVVLMPGSDARSLETFGKKVFPHLRAL